MMSITFHKPDGTPADPAPAGIAVTPVKKMGPPVRHAIPKASEIPKAESPTGISEIQNPEASFQPEVSAKIPALAPATPPAIAKLNFPSSQPVADRSKAETVLAAQPAISQGIHVPNFTTPPKSAPAPFEVKSFPPRNQPQSDKKKS
jgi:hypothetical protein